MASRWRLSLSQLWNVILLKPAQSAVLAPLQLQRVWLPFSRAVAICGSVGTSPPPPIGHPRHRRLLLDATRHGSGIETQGQAGNQVMQLLEATYQRLHPYNERVHNPSVHSNNTASQTDSMPRPLRVQLVNAPDRPIRLLELCTTAQCTVHNCTVQAILLLPLLSKGRRRLLIHILEHQVQE